MRKILFLSCLVVLIFGVMFATHLHEKPQPELVCEFEFALVPVDNVTNLIIWHKIPENFEMGIKLHFADENIDIQAKNLSLNKVYLYQINKKTEREDPVFVIFHDAYSPKAKGFSHRGRFWDLSYKIGNREIVRIFIGPI